MNKGKIIDQAILDMLKGTGTPETRANVEFMRRQLEAFLEKTTLIGESRIHSFADSLEIPVGKDPQEP